MQIDWAEKVGGYTMLQVRDLMKRMVRLRPDDLGERIGPGGDPVALTTELLARGWIEESRGYLRPTLQGNAVGMAKKLKPITRAQADELVEQVTAAANAINSDDRYSHDVSKLAVFGSYLNDAPLLNDVDLAFELSGRWVPSGEPSMEAVTARSNDAWPPPHSLQWIDRLFWPERVVMKRLRVSRRVSFEEFKSVIDFGWPYRMLL